MNQKKRLLFLFSVIIYLALTIFGVSIAFFSYVKEGTTESTVKLGGITFKYTENGDSGNGININDSFPISDEEGKKMSGAGNVFEFKVESNLSRSDLEYEITVEATKESELPLDAIKFYLVELDGENEKEIGSTLNSDGTVKTLADFSDTNIVEQTGKNVYQETILKNTKGYVKKFRVRMWISEDIDWADDNYANKSGQLRVNVYANSDRTTASTDTTTPDDVRIERVTANNKYLFTKVDSEVYQYELTVPNEVSVLDINVIPTNMSAVSSVTNMDNLEEFGLNVGENYFRAVVTSSNGKKKKEYILKVIREKSNNTGLNKLEVEDYSLVPSYSDGNDEYTVTVPYDKTSIIVSAEKKEQIQEVTGLGTYNLTVGANDISVKVTAEDGTVRVIRINVIRSKSTDASIKNVKVEGYSLTYVEGNIYSVTIPNEVNSVEIKNVSETGATVDNIGIKSGLKVGNNDYEVTVTSQDGSNVIKYIIRVIRLADSDNTLKSLSLSSCTLSPTFASGTTSYTCTVENSVTSTTVTATATSSVATVSGTGSKSLNVGSNTVSVVVTSESGSVKTYIVTVTRKANSDATLKSLTVSSGTLSPAFNKDVLIYTLEVPYSVDNITITGEVNVNTSNVEGLGSKVLKVGENGFDIVVTAEDKTTKTYNITVTRKEDSDTSLKSIGVKGYDIVKVDNNNYTLTVENNVTSVEIVAEALSSVASVSGTGVKSLKVGKNKFGVIVTAQNGDISTYNVVITRKASSDATLKGLKVSSGTLSPTFASGTTSYTLTVPYSVTSLTVTPTVNNSEAKTSVTGNTSLKVGSNTVSIVVTAGDGTKKTYTITVTRSKDTTNTLKSLAVSGYSLTPTFASGTTEYTLTLEASSITVTATATSSVATVSGTGSKSLNWGTNTISVIVTSQSGSIKTYKITVDNQRPTAPVLQGGSDSWVSTAPTISIKTAGGAISGVKNYEYYKSTSNTAPTDTTTATGTTTGNLTVSDEGTSYVWYRTVSNNGFKSSWTSSSQVIKLDTIKPTATAITYNGGSNSCIWKNNYNLTLSSSAASGISHYEIDVDSNGTADLTTSSNFIPVNNWSTCKARFRAVSNSGLVGDWTAEQHIHMDTESPKFTNWWWGEVTKDVARLYVQATDNVGLQSPAGAYNNHNSGVFCPTSTASGGYGNWTWFAATWDATANAYRCDITPATFGHYGQTYTTHLYIYDYAGNGGYYNATTVNIPASCSYANGSIWEFNYTGGIQTFTAPCSGTYKLEVYGAQGGNQLSTGGLGGYSYGNVSLATSQSIYVGVGGAGSYSHGSSYTGSAAGGYNGGGSGVRVDKDEDGDYQDAGGGGGATHIATTNRGILANYNSYRSEVLIVAGGGGGGANASSAGGTGGGVNGGAGVTNVGWYAYGGTQTGGGANSGNNYSPTTASSFGTGSSGIIGGGGGWFGGGSAGGSYGFADATGKYSTAGGGSGYIGGVSGGSMQNGVRAGNGYAKITLVASN